LPGLEEVAMMLWDSPPSPCAVAIESATSWPLAAVAWQLWRGSGQGGEPKLVKILVRRGDGVSGKPPQGMVAFGSKQSFENRN